MGYTTSFSGTIEVIELKTGRPAPVDAETLKKIHYHNDNGFKTEDGRWRDTIYLPPLEIHPATVPEGRDACCVTMEAWESCKSWSPVEATQRLLDDVLKPKGWGLSGHVLCDGEDFEDLWLLECSGDTVDEVELCIVRRDELPPGVETYA